MTEEDVMPAVVELISCLSFIPKVAAFQKRLAAFLVAIVGSQDIYKNQTREDVCTIKDGVEYWGVKKSGGICCTPNFRLDWLVTALIEHVGRWPENGFADVRALYCHHFEPADGKESTNSPEILELVPPPVPDPPPQKYLKAADEESIDDIQKQIEAAAEKMRGGK